MVGVALVIVIIAAASIQSCDEPGAVRTAEDQPVERQERRAQPEPEPELTVREKIVGCLSEFDGNHDGFEDQIRPLLSNEGSMETHLTRFTTEPIGDESVLIEMVYSAENAFGGRVKTTATGFLNFESCLVTVVTTGLE